MQSEKQILNQKRETQKKRSISFYRKEDKPDKKSYVETRFVIRTIIPVKPNIFKSTTWSLFNQILIFDQRPIVTVDASKSSTPTE